MRAQLSCEPTAHFPSLGSLLLTLSLLLLLYIVMLAGSSLLLFIFSGFIAASSGLQHNVGDKAGWKLPSLAKINYTDWASQYSYRVEDTLHFRYDKATSNVLQVSFADYSSCTNSSPIESYYDGDTLVYLLRDGWYWFICGASNHCSLGQKFFVRVLPFETQNSSNSSFSSSGASGKPASAPKGFYSFRGARTLPASVTPALPISASSVRSIHSLATKVLFLCFCFFLT